jgi:hypothetical protein
MIECRPFRNDDPPAIAEIWGAQPPSRGLMQPMTAAAFEHIVLAKPHFDRHGLLIAIDQGRPVGLAHAGFGPTADGSSLDRSRGIVCLLMSAPLANQDEIAGELLRCAEEYLRSKGAVESFAGCCEGVNPFYLGIYGGCGSPGILATDATALRAFAAAGYRPAQRRCVFQRDLVAFRVPVDRQLIDLKRKLQLDFQTDDAPVNWWDAALFSHVERIHSSLAPRGGTPVWATASFWDIEPLASTWGVHALGLLAMKIHDAAAGANPSIVATQILAESLRMVQSQGITLAEVQTLEDDQPMIEIFKRLGFTEVASGVSLRKSFV